MYVSRTMTSVVPAVLQLLTVIIGTPLKFIKIASNVSITKFAAVKEAEAALLRRAAMLSQRADTYNGKWHWQGSGGGGG
jgi:hypothetical protein